MFMKYGKRSLECCHHGGMGVHGGESGQQQGADPVFGPALVGRQAQAAAGRSPSWGRGKGSSGRNWEKDSVTTFTVYTVMVKEEQGWRQLVAPALRPERACQALAELIRSDIPLDQPSDEDQRYAEDALRLCEQDNYELTIGDRRHRLVRADLVISIGADGPEGPRAHDRVFIEFPWQLDN